MRALTLLQSSLEKALESVHPYRLCTLWFAVEALLVGEKLTLTWLGRAGQSQAFAKHRIKRVCRFLGNKRMHGNLITAYRAAAHFLLGTTPRPIILVDWTPIGLKRLNHALVATSPIGGRSVVLYAEVHPEKLLGTRAVENQFLVRLKAVLPPSCMPIIVTDAGFRTRWFDAVEKLGWSSVGRLSSRTMIIERNGVWVRIARFWPQARSKAVDLGMRCVTMTNSRVRRCVLVKAQRGMKRAKTPARYVYKPRSDYANDEKRKPRATERFRKKAPEPWFLVSSIEDCTANRIVQIYKMRMQIEETFRDLKSQRFGWSFDESRSSDPKRVEVLILIAALAALVVLLAGIAAEREGLERQHQTNTQRKRRVLSLMFLGRLLIARNGRDLSGEAIRDSHADLNRMIATNGGLE
jgi:hypothetical protein